MSKKRILVAEDETGIRNLTVTILKKEGYEVVAAGDGKIALEILEKNNFKFDLLLTDIYMPQMSGLDLAAEVLQKNSELAVVIMTAFKDDETVMRAFELGVFEFISKPFDLVTLTRTVQKVFERKARMEPGETMKIESGVRGWCEITCSSDFEYVERFRKFTAMLYGTNLDEGTIEDIKVAIDELGRNAVEWGNKRDKSKKIHLSYCVFDDKIVFKIEDEGEGFKAAAVDDPTIDPIAHITKRTQQGKRIGGYGLYITKKLMDEVFYNERGNIVLLTKYLHINPEKKGEIIQADDNDEKNDKSNDQTNNSQ